MERLEGQAQVGFVHGDPEFREEVQHDKRGGVPLEKAGERTRGIRPGCPRLERELLKSGEATCLEEIVNVRVGGVDVEYQCRYVWEEAVESMRDDRFGSNTGKIAREHDDHETTKR